MTVMIGSPGEHQASEEYCSSNILGEHGDPGLTLCSAVASDGYISKCGQCHPDLTYIFNF